MTLAAGSPLARLIAGPMRPGHVAWIGLRPGRRIDPVAVGSVLAEAGRGLAGDRYAERARRDGDRQVTLVAAEHLDAVASFLGRKSVDPALVRRNILVRDVNLLALKGRRFRIGEARLEWTGECHPCSRMEEALGPGGYNAMRGHGGITARVLETGTIRLGDALALAPEPPVGMPSG
jgi:MOSC domain-containing protein YiiM